MIALRKRTLRFLLAGPLVTLAACAGEPADLNDTEPASKPDAVTKEGAPDPSHVSTRPVPKRPEKAATVPAMPIPKRPVVQAMPIPKGPIDQKTAVAAIKKLGG